MKAPDYSEYEKRRAEAHEDSWRLAATFANIRSRHCRYRMCRRHQLCYGPMLPSSHQNGVIRAHQEIGLSGTACASLPMCMANATADHYAHVRSILDQLNKLRQDEMKHKSASEVLFLMQIHMRSRHRDAEQT